MPEQAGGEPADAEPGDQQPVGPSKKRPWRVRFAVWVGGAALANQPTGAPSARDESSADEQYRDLLGAIPGRIRRFVDAESALERYRQLEELSWRSGTRELQNLAWLLRAKHEESVRRAHRNSFTGGWLNFLGATLSLAGAIGIVCGWVHIVSFVTVEPKTGAYRVPDRLWMIVLATTAATLLVGAAAGLLFDNARRFHERSAAHEREADSTRRVEAAVRIALLGLGTDATQEDVHDAVQDVVARLLEHQQAPLVHSVGGLPSSLPTEAVKQLSEFVEALGKLVGRIKGG